MEELIDDPVILARAQATFELIELAEQMMRQNLRRWHPHESEDEIERRLVSWYRKEPRSRWNGKTPPFTSSDSLEKALAQLEAGFRARRLNLKTSPEPGEEPLAHLIL